MEVKKDPYTSEAGIWIDVLLHEVVRAETWDTAGLAIDAIRSVRTLQKSHAEEWHRQHTPPNCNKQ